MRKKGGKKSTIKKASKDKKIIKLRLNNGAEIPAKTIYKKDDDFFEINDIDIDKIRISDKKLYNIKHDSYKHYVFHEDGDKYIPLRIIFKDVLGFYNDYKDNGKKMRFKLDDVSLGKSIDIFELIGKNLKIAIIKNLSLFI